MYLWLIQYHTRKIYFVDTRVGTANKIVETSGKFQEFQLKYKDYMSRKKAISLVFVTCGRRHYAGDNTHYTPVHFWYECTFNS